MSGEVSAPVFEKPKNASRFFDLEGRLKSGCPSIEGGMNWRSSFRFVVLVAVFVPHSESRNARVVMKSIKKPECHVPCTVVLLEGVYRHAFFAKSFRAKPTIRKD
jgi:hypothetical protein